jgi:ABC-2 type transport system ATP-binding protein
MLNPTLNSALKISNLHKNYGKFSVIRDLNLDIAPNSIHGLVGLNGSGKTTTLECILGMQRFDQGQISVLGHKPSHLHEAEGAVVGIFDTPSLHPNLTVRQSLEHATILCKNPVRSCEEVESLLGITTYRKFKIRHLSLGNKRRASIAHALIGNPELIVLDEPFNGLDAEGVEDVLKLIKNLNQEAGTAFLLSSHQLPYLEQICSHLAILHNGCIVVSDKIESLFQSHKTSLLISCDSPEKARDLVEKSGLATYQAIDGGQLQFELGSGTAIEINRLLVNAGIGVSELSLKQESLTSLFHSITSSTDATTSSANGEESTR